MRLQLPLMPTVSAGEAHGFVFFWMRDVLCWLGGNILKHGCFACGKHVVFMCVYA